MEDFYPEILDVAEQHGLVRQRSNAGSKREVRFNCPFCLANVGKEDRGYKLYINPHKRKFHCFRCNTEGGVVVFMSLLSGKSEEQIVADLTETAKQKNPMSNPNPKKKKSGWASHPAMLLTGSQWRAMGFTSKVTNKDFERDASLARRTLEWAWKEWKNFEYEKMQDAFEFVVRFHVTGLELYRDRVQEHEKEFGLKLWEKAEQLYFMPCRFWPDWAIHKEAFVLQPRIQILNYRLWMENRKKFCSCKSEHNDVKCKMRDIQRLQDLVNSHERKQNA